MSNIDDARKIRSRRAKTTAVLNIFAQVIQIATGLISVPLTLEYIGPERFGMWMALSAALAFITFSDFGIGIGMQDRVSILSGKGDENGARNAFYSAIFLTSSIAVTIVAFGYFALQIIDLKKIFSIKSLSAQEEATSTALTTILIIAIGIVSGVIQRAFNAFQEGFWVAILQVASRLISLVLLFVAVKFKTGLPVLVFVTGGLTSCILLLFGIPILLHRKKWLRTKFWDMAKSVDKKSIEGLISIGMMGLGASIAIYLINNSIPTILATKYSAQSVADFSVLFKIIAIPGLLLTYVLNPFWPAITEAKQKRDYGWIKNIYKKSMFIVTVTAVLSGLVIINFAKPAIGYWTKASEIMPSTELIWATTAFMIIGFWNSACSMILNGLSCFKGQATYGLVIAILSASICIMTPTDLPKEWVIWIISAGFAVRCIFMQVEIRKEFRVFSQREAQLPK